MKKEIRTLTGLRGVAAMFVLLYHFCENDTMLQDRLPWLIQKGYLAVDLFFVLSGFLMAYTYVEFFRESFSWKHYRIYIVKRIARIYPLYLFMLLFFLAQYMASYHAGGQHIDGGYGVVDFMADLFMVQAWGFDFKAIEPAAWAVSVEFFAYLIFPVLLYITGFTRPATAAIMAVVGIAFLMMVKDYFPGRHGPLDASTESFGPLLRCLGGFILGIVCCRLAHGVMVGKVMKPSVVILLLVAGLGVAGYFQADDLVLYAFFPLIVTTLAFEAKLPRIIFANPLVYHLGVISYAVYLVHPLFVGVKTHIDMQTETMSAHFVTFAGMLLLTWFASVLLHNRIDLPGRRFIARVFLPKIAQK